MFKEVHPIRATVAVVSIGATVAFLQQGIGLPDAWWAILASVSTFYFMQKD